ncbi:MAG: hypothetical protein GWO24_20870 [Akkermansiaceae bacterium]|nr:hypothetical protein [Akkermansiaceae bacterium]
MFKRIGNIIKGIFLRLIGKAERANPEALLEVEKENLRRQIGEFNKGLATHAALVERLFSRAKKLNSEEETLRAKTAANLKAGNRAAAGQLALKLKAVDKEHDEVREQLEAAEKRYKELVRARDVSVKERGQGKDRKPAARDRRHEGPEGHGGAQRDGIGNGDRNRRGWRNPQPA